MGTLWKSIKWVWWIILGFILVNLVLGVFSEIISENIPARIKDLVFSNVVKFITLCLLHWKVVITILVVFLAFTIYVWYKEKTRESTTIWELRKSNTNLNAEDARIQKYNRAYISRQSDLDIVSLLNKDESVLITGKPNIGKTRAAFESIKRLKRVSVIKPKPKDLEERTVGLPILGNKNIVFFIDDLQRFIGTNVEEIIAKLKTKSKKLILVATCKTGSELELIREEAPELLREFTVLELDEISKEEGKELASKVGKEWNPEQFDGTPGSVILDLAGMTERYKKTEDGKVILKALKLMHEGNIYVHRERRVKDLCREIFELPMEKLSRYKWDEIINNLIESNFITIKQQYIDVYPSYLDTCVYDYDPPRNDLILLKKLLYREKDSGGLLYLGQSFARKVAFREAEDCYRKALSIYPRYAHAYNSLGYLLSKLGEDAQNKGGFEEAYRLCKEAEAQYRESLTINHNYVSSYTNLGFVLSKLGEIDEFKGEYNKAKSLYLEAVEQYKKAIELRPRHASAHQNFGYTLVKLGDYEEAKKEYSRSIELNAESPYAHNLLGYLLSKLGVAEEAKGRRNEAHVLYREAEKEYREAIRLKSDYPSVHNN